MSNLVIIKLADKNGTRKSDGSWPLLGVMAREVPKKLRMSIKQVAKGINEGWIVPSSDIRTIRRSGGSPSNPADKVHVFPNADYLTFKFVDAEYRYVVSEQPDKYPEATEGKYGFGGEIKWYYDLELVS